MLCILHGLLSCQANTSPFHTSFHWDLHPLWWPGSWRSPTVQLQSWDWSNSPANYVDLRTHHYSSFSKLGTGQSGWRHKLLSSNTGLHFSAQKKEELNRVQYCLFYHRVCPNQLCLSVSLYFGVVGMGTYASYYHKAWLGRTAQVTYGGDVGIQN